MSTNQIWPPPITKIVGGPGIMVSFPYGPSQGEVTIQTDDYGDRFTREKEMREMKEKIRFLEERLLILHPNTGLHEKYPALKNAYDSYQLIEKLINGPTK